ncbi:unnamed protein product [Allacma fusca]|uniref:Uncharacterized protein n=1 Tax=Allacma fusca TaxID=39272 RepID=A0A8J2P995_9HEXA|nr:unnamed protein product [Allacma fusca]
MNISHLRFYSSYFFEKSMKTPQIGAVDTHNVACNPVIITPHPSGLVPAAQFSQKPECPSLYPCVSPLESSSDAMAHHIS